MSVTFSQEWAMSVSDRSKGIGAQVRALVFVGGLLMVLGAISVSAAAAEGLAHLSKDYAYWRGLKEESPGPFLCVSPAATDVTVVCDRWPDGSDLKQFGLDAVRLSGARGEQEQCIAIWRWVRRWTMYTDGNPPTEKFLKKKKGYIDDPIKVLNVYGTHWCDGLSRAVECVRRALGHRAEKFYRGGHTMVNCYYADYDGVKRWHLFDVSEGGFMYDRCCRRLLTPTEMNTDYYNWMAYWVHCPHLEMPTHRMELGFRVGEKLERIWGNQGKPYQDNVRRDHQTVPEWERGPYEVDYGNGCWSYAPDLSKPDWVNGLAEPPANMAPGKLVPAKAGKLAAAVWQFRTPYIISDAEVQVDFVRKSDGDTIRLYLSVDDGASWKKLWECAPGEVGRRWLTVPVCDKFKVTKEALPPAEFNSPFGRYAYRLKLELFARDRSEDCEVKGIRFKTYVQHNIYSLPQLQPGRNMITVKAQLAEGIALRLTCLWDDSLGKARKNVTVIEQAPWTYEILAAGRKWEDVVCRSITIEAVPATRGGNRTEIKEKPSEIQEVPPLRSAAETRARWKRPTLAELPPIEELIEGLEDPDERRQAIFGLLELGDPRAFDAVKKAAYEYGKTPVKEAALVALYVMDKEKARPILLDIISDPKRSRWKTDPENPAVEGEHWATGAAMIGYMAEESGWDEFVPYLVKVLESPYCWRQASWGLLRVVGRFGDKRAANMVKKYLDAKDLDTVSVAAEAAGPIGDVAMIPGLRQLLNSGYEPARINAAVSLGMLGDRASAPKLREWLTDITDENFRGGAAKALGEMGDRDSIPALEAALVVEPVAWVREEIAGALATLQAR